MQVRILSATRTTMANEDPKTWCDPHWKRVIEDERVNGIAATVHLGNAFVDILRTEKVHLETVEGYNDELRKRGPVCCQLTEKQFLALLQASMV